MIHQRTITDNDIRHNTVEGLPAKLAGSVGDNQSLFDKYAALIRSRFNLLISDLGSQSIASELKARDGETTITVQGHIDNTLRHLSTKDRLEIEKVALKQDNLFLGRTTGTAQSLIISYDGVLSEGQTIVVVPHVDVEDDASLGVGTQTGNLFQVTGVRVKSGMLLKDSPVILTFIENKFVFKYPPLRNPFAISTDVVGDGSESSPYTASILNGGDEKARIGSTYSLKFRNNNAVNNPKLVLAGRSGVIVWKAGIFDTSGNFVPSGFRTFNNGVQLPSANVLGFEISGSPTYDVMWNGTYWVIMNDTISGGNNFGNWTANYDGSLVVSKEFSNSGSISSTSGSTFFGLTVGNVTAPKASLSNFVCDIRSIQTANNVWFVRDYNIGASMVTIASFTAYSSISRSSGTYTGMLYGNGTWR